MNNIFDIIGQEPTPEVIAAPAPVTETEGNKKKRKPQDGNNKRQSKNDIKFISENASTMTSREIAEKLGLTYQQVNITKNNLRKLAIEEANNRFGSDQNKLVKVLENINNKYPVVKRNSKEDKFKFYNSLFSDCLDI